MRQLALMVEQAFLTPCASGCRQLVLVHEPEAVAVRAVKGNQNPGSPMQLKEDETVIILDAGGGTVDVTCHKVSLLINDLFTSVTSQ